MPVMSASSIQRRFRGAQEITRTYKGGALIWQKLVPAVDGPEATGGTISTITDSGVTYRVHRFTASDTLTFTRGGMVDYLIGGGGSRGFGLGGIGGSGVVIVRYRL
jgi:hypothetical protein